MRFSYQCTDCGQVYEIGQDIMLCPVCSLRNKPNLPLFGILEVIISGTLPRNHTVFDLLPVDREFFPDIPVGNTPLWEPKILREALDMPHLFIKDDGKNPTGSLKDRASYLVSAFALSHGIADIVVASTGNAASSMAGIGASAGLSVTIFVPKSAPPAKLVQCQQFGARVIPVDGNYDMAFDLSTEFAEKTGSLSRNTAFNPMTIEGKKTVSFEIHRQMGRVPDYIFVPTGDGVILSGVYKGFRDLVRLGLSDKLPIVIAVLAEGSSAIHDALLNNNIFPDEPKTAHTIADSISVDVPKCGNYAVKLLMAYGGRAVTVTDDEILDAQLLLSTRSGLFTEPAGAASFAGLLKIRQEIPEDASVCILTTGSGLKDVQSAQKKLSPLPVPIKSI
jgi:threonine synthase